MAEVNTVPLGQAGTGAAFVLQPSQAAQQLQQTLEYNQQIAQREQLLKQQQAQQLANSWKTNQLKVDGGLYWQPEFNKRYQDHLQKGIQLRQMGVDPFNYNPSDPNQSKIAENYLLERQQILQDTANRKALEENVQKQFGLLKGNPSNFYASDIQALNDYVAQPFAQASQGQVPTLTERFNPNTVLSKVTPAQVGSEVVVGDKRIKSVKALPTETRSAIVSAYKNDPASERWVNEMTGGVGFTIDELERVPKSLDSIKAEVERNYKGNPQLRTQLAQQGITPNSDAYKQYVDQQTQRLYTAKSAWDNQITSDLNQILPQVKAMESVLPDYTAEDQAMARRRLQLAEEASARDRQRLERGEIDSDTLYRKEWVRDMLNGVEGSGEKLKGVVEGMEGYQGEVAINTTDPNEIKIQVPARITTKIVDGKPKSVAIPQRDFTVKKGDANAESKLNSFLNEVTGEKISESKFRTGNASGKTKTTKQGTTKSSSTKTASMSQVRSLVGKPGYEGYSEKELIDYYKSQGYTIK